MVICWIHIRQVGDGTQQVNRSHQLSSQGMSPAEPSAAYGNWKMIFFLVVSGIFSYSAGELDSPAEQSGSVTC